MFVSIGLRVFYRHLLYYTERSLDGSSVELGWWRVDGEREEAARGGLGTVPERDCVPHRSSYGSETCSYIISLSVSLQSVGP